MRFTPYGVLAPRMTANKGTRARRAAAHACCSPHPSHPSALRGRVAAITAARVSRGPRRPPSTCGKSRHDVANRDAIYGKSRHDVADAVLLLDTQLREVLQRDLHLEMVLRKPACADLERAAVVESCR